MSEVVARFCVPAVIGELMAGLIVGPSLLGWVELGTIMKLLAEIGIILLLFEVGMDTNLCRLAFSQHFGFKLPMGKASGLEFSPSPQLAHRLEEQVRPLIHTFSPLFFVMVGVSLDLNAVDWGSPLVWMLAGALLLAAFAGKFAAGFFIREPRRPSGCLSRR